jgi:hypothetical protein
MENPRPQSDSPEPTSEAQATTGEIVTIRRRLAELELGRNAIPAEATEALEVLEKREHDLRDRLAELQEMFTDPGHQTRVDVTDELARTDQASLIPRV